MQPATCNLQPPTTSPPRFALRKGLGFWQLTFEGRRTVLKHEQGIFYVAYLLTHPPQEPIHGLALALKTLASYCQPRSIAQIVDPSTGQPVPVDREASLQEYDLGLDDVEAAGALRRKQRELEAILDSQDECEPVKAEALRELEAIYNYQKSNPDRLGRTAQKCVRTVRMAIKRFHRHLALSLDERGKPNRILRRFADHLEKHLLVPSARFSGRKGARARTGIAGRFTYEPPPNVAWLA